MRTWFRHLDELLRGRKTGPELLKSGCVEMPLRVFIPLAVLLGASYGFFMGWYGLTGRQSPSYLQLVASTVKLPALFLLTLAVTFPSLYVFNALVGCRLNTGTTLRLLIGAIVVNVAVAASFGPILAFFTISTTSYAFIVLMNVGLLGIAGIVGLGFLLQTLRRLATSPTRPTQTASLEPASDTTSNTLARPPQREPGPLERTSLPDDDALGEAHLTFRIWLLIYGLVGVQMGWILRPFIGNPGQEFTWFRARQGNFFLAVVQQIKNLFDLGH